MGYNLNLNEDEVRIKPERGVDTWHDMGHTSNLNSFPTTPHTQKSELKRRSYDLNKLEKKTN